MSWHLNDEEKTLPHNRQAAINDDLIRLYRSTEDAIEREEILNKLLIINKPLVLSWAKLYYKKYSNYNIPFNDLVQEASLAILVALPKYELPEFQDRKRTASFSTFSSWYIRKAVSKYCKLFYKSVRVTSPYSVDSQSCTLPSETSKEPLDILETDRLHYHLLDLDDQLNLLQLVEKLTTPEELIIYAVYNGVYGYETLRKNTIRRTATILNLPAKYITAVVNRVDRLLRCAVENEEV